MGETARSAGLERLYHYEKFNPEYLRDTLVNKHVHCSSPAELNDPWDCRPWFDDEALGDPKALDGLFDFFFACNPTADVSEAEKCATRAHAHRDRDYGRQILNRFSEDFLKMIPNRWRVYCLTPFPDSTLMWSHYADNHKGICLEFALGDRLFGSAQKVEYLATYPKCRHSHCLTAHRNGCCSRSLMIGNMSRNTESLALVTVSLGLTRVR
jgi:hypothetical protein